MDELSLIKNIAYALAYDHDHYGLLRDILADLIPEDEYEELSYEEIYEKYKENNAKEEDSKMKGFEYFKTLIDNEVVDRIDLVNDEENGEFKILLTIGKEVSVEPVDKTIMLAVYKYFLSGKSSGFLIREMIKGDTATLSKSTYDGGGMIFVPTKFFTFNLSNFGASMEIDVDEKHSYCSEFYGTREGFALEVNDTEGSMERKITKL